MSVEALARAGDFAQARSPWVVERIGTVELFLSRCARLEHVRAEPFQHRSWLDSWYASVARQPGVEPLLLAVRAEGDRTDAMLIPLIARRRGALKVVECADLGVTDFNGFILREGLTLDEADAAALGRVLKDSLRDFDLLHLDKLVTHTDGQPNPGLRLFASVTSPLSGHRLCMPETYADWMQHIGKRARKEFERCWRVFQRTPDARFVRARDVAEGLRLLRCMAALQHRRHAATRGYRLDQPAYDSFYEHFLRANLDSGRCVVTALMAGDDMVAGLFSIHDGRRLTMLRIATGGEQWKSCAPGKLLLERTLHALHHGGCREFDFGIGDYEHKRVFRATPVPLREACIALSLRGHVASAAWRLKRALRNQPALRAAVLQLRRARQAG